MRDVRSRVTSADRTALLRHGIVVIEVDAANARIGVTGERAAQRARPGGACSPRSLAPRCCGRRPGGVSMKGSKVYDADVVKRTNINLDMDLVAQAAHELGTRRTTDTVHEALRAVVARRRRARLAQRDFEGLAPESLDAMRRPAGRTA
jgi:Arc/MetJ family transcription regulator